MKQHPEDQVWNVIIAHAKERFDYDGFIVRYGAFENERVYDTVLFQLIVGFAEGETNQMIAEHLQYDLRMLGYSFAENDFEPFVARHGLLFAEEVAAAKVALDQLKSGAGVEETRLRVERILS